MNNYSNQKDYVKSIPVLEKPYPLQIQMFGYPNVDYNTNQNIYNQLKLFEQTLQLNHTTTLELIEVILFLFRKLMESPITSITLIL